MEFIKKYRVIGYLLLIILISMFITINYFNNKKAKEIIIERKTILDEQIPTKDDLPSIDFESIRKKYKNKDIKGALRITNEDFEAIVFQTDNNDYYLTHSYDGKKANGELFLDYRLNIDTSNIKLIYGQGSHKSKIIEKYLQEDYYKNHKYIELETDKLIYKYEIISVYEGNLNINKMDINHLINNSRIIYNKEFTEKGEFIIYQNTINNKVLSIIGQRVKINS